MILVKVVPYFFHERNIVDLGEIFKQSLRVGTANSMLILTYNSRKGLVTPSLYFAKCFQVVRKIMYSTF